MTELTSVCMLTADIDSPTGGVQGHAIRLLRELSARGIKTSVCTRNYLHLARDQVQDGIRIHRSPVWRRSLRVANSAAYLADAVAWLVRHRAEYDVMHCQQMFGPAIAGLLAKRFTDKPVVVRVSSTGELGEVADVRRMTLSSARIRLLQQVDHWVALTRLMASEIQTLGVAPERITVIPNAAVIPADSATVAQTRLKYRRRLGLDYSRIAIYSGRLSSEKNLDTLLEAWADVWKCFPDAHLLFAGASGAFRIVEPQLREMQRTLQLCDSVHFLGHVSNVMDYLLAADVFVLPTSTEGMSNALLEAMAAGNAIVSTDIEANREVVSDGITALLVPPRDVNALSAGIKRLFSSPEFASELGDRAVSLARKKHSVAAMTTAYLDVYEQARSRARYALFSKA